MKGISLRRIALLAAVVAAGAIASGSFGATGAKAACLPFGRCTVTVHVTGAGQANSGNAIGNHICVSPQTTPTGQEGATCTYEFGWGWVGYLNSAWSPTDGWSFSRWSGSGYAHPDHCDGEDSATNTYAGGICQFQIWQDLEIRAEFVDTQPPDTVIVTAPSGYYQRSTSATFSF